MYTIFSGREFLFDSICSGKKHNWYILERSFFDFLCSIIKRKGIIISKIIENCFPNGMNYLRNKNLYLNTSFNFTLVSALVPIFLKEFHLLRRHFSLIIICARISACQ